jgi:hypothetical protein
MDLAPGAEVGGARIGDRDRAQGDVGAMEQNGSRP